MLELLHIENIAVIEKADIEFAPGLNVLTGETGAGKSIVIDALEAITGGRTSRDIVRNGQPYATVSGVFDCAGAEAVLDELGISPDDGRLFVTRRISADGKNVCRINGVPVPVAELKTLGASLVDIHGQNDGRKLLDEQSHLKYLDGYAGSDPLLAEYKDRFSEMKALHAEIKALDMDEGEKERRADMLRFQINELESADITVGELDKLKERRELLNNASKLMDAVDDAFSALYGGERSDGAVTLTEEAASSLAGVAHYSEKLAEISDRINNIRYDLEDTSEQLRDFKDELDFSPNELDEIEGRISLLKRLMRKYAPDEQSLLDSLESAKQELEGIEYSDEKKRKLEKELVSVIQEAEKSAAALSKARKCAAKTLEIRIAEELAQLNMKSVRFSVHFDSTDFTPSGKDDVSFLMSANAGEELGRISKIASGGELSRIMLAMKNVLAENDTVGTMVFDEIDTGVSGIAAQRVGEKLWELGNARQVLCVTHLPQIAAMADNQFSVEKSTLDGRTFTHVNSLDKEGRKSEIARLTGGDNITDNTLLSAEEQLSAAENYKKNYLDKH